MSEYPNCEKLAADEMLPLWGFLDWLEANGYQISTSESGRPVFDTEDLVYRYRGIDKKEVEQERKHMLSVLKSKLDQETL